jgi:hypothetical protein
MLRKPSDSKRHQSRYRHDSGLIDPKKVGPYIAEQRLVSPEELESGKACYPADLIPHAAHPKLQALIAEKPEVMRDLQVYALHWFNHFTTHLEHDFVNVVLLGIAYDKQRLGLPSMMRHDAFAIYLEEANHAHVADDLSFQIAMVTGAPTKTMPRPLFYRRTRELEKLIPREHNWLIKPLFAVGTETSITGVLSQVPKHNGVVTAVRDVLRDHATDEAKHSAYFTAYFEQLWEQLLRSQRLAVSPFLPAVIRAFLEPDWRAIRHQLGGLGLKSKEVDQVIAETYPEGEVAANIAASAAATIALFRRNRVLDDHRTMDIFGKYGLIS